MTQKAAMINIGFVLFAISGFLATRSDKTFTGVGSAYFYVDGEGVKTLFKGLTTVPHLTTTNTSHTAFIRTSGGYVGTLFKGPRLTVTLFYK